MTVGGSIFIIAVGAILYYAVDFDVSGVDINTVGVILMIAGAVALVLSLFYTAVWARQSSRWYRGRGYDAHYDAAPPPPPPDEPTRPL
jgi:hypothetical protein